MPLNEFISVINEPLKTLIRGIKVYSIAEPVARGSQVVPVVVGNNGEITYVGPDDLQTVIIYHKVNALNSRPSTAIRGTGNDPNATINVYSLSMIVWLDRKKTKLRPEDMILYIQANMPYEIKADNYIQTVVQIDSAVLNGQQVYGSEFQGVESKLPANQSMLQINYRIESTFKKKCFEKCPED
jgi:hypothetical protein